VVRTRRPPRKNASSSPAYLVRSWALTMSVYSDAADGRTGGVTLSGVTSFWYAALTSCGVAKPPTTMRLSVYC